MLVAALNASCSRGGAASRGCPAPLGDSTARDDSQRAAAENCLCRKGNRLVRRNRAHVLRIATPEQPGPEPAVTASKASNNFQISAAASSGDDRPSGAVLWVTRCAMVDVIIFEEEYWGLPRIIKSCKVDHGSSAKHSLVPIPTGPLHLLPLLESAAQTAQLQKPLRSSRIRDFLNEYRDFF